MNEREKILAQEVSDLLGQAEDLNAAEDAQFGKDRRGDELRRRESRLAKIREALQALEDDARARAEERARTTAEKKSEDDDTTARRVAHARARAVPRPTAQPNFPPQADGWPTDPQSRIMKTSDGSFHQCYNGQTMSSPTPATPARTTSPKPSSSQTRPAPSSSSRPAEPSQAKHGHRVYARQRVIVEPVFGRMGTLQNGQHLLLRDLEQARSEWSLLAACHNLRKLHRHLGIDGLAGLGGAGDHLSGGLTGSPGQTRSRPKRSKHLSNRVSRPRATSSHQQRGARQSNLHESETRLLTQAPS